jgi:hypothetical protein
MILPVARSISRGFARDGPRNCRMRADKSGFFGLTGSGMNYFDTGDVYDRQADGKT